MAWAKVATDVSWFIGVLNDNLYAYSISSGGKGILIKIDPTGVMTVRDAAYIFEGSPHAVTIDDTDGVVYYGQKLNTDSLGWVFETF